MEIVRGLHNLRERHHGCALTIGNYDGMHLGHQAVMADLRRRADALGLPATVMSFEPTPREFFAPESAPPRLASMRERIEDFAAHGVDRLVYVRFDEAFAALSPAVFVEDLLVARLGARVVLVGRDFRFGASRAGDTELLAAYGREHGFEFAPVPTVSRHGERVSSTRVRAALAGGELGLAAELLGRPYRMSGRVAGGARLGRTLDVPTANLPIRRRPAPAFGVYAVRARLADGRLVDGAANLGTRPTVNGTGCLLEVHLLDFHEDLYGQRMEVYFHEYLRSEERFETTEALREQMLSDIDQARAVLANTRAESP